MLRSIQEPCGESVIHARLASAPCSKLAGRWVLVATTLASSMAFIDSTVVNVALPALQTNLNATIVDVQWVIEAYSLLLSALLLVGGSLGDHYGRRRVSVIGGWLIEHLSWRAIFFINIPIALLIIFVSLWRVPESSDKESKGLDWLGAILITLGLGALVYGLIESSRLGFGARSVLSALAAAAALLTLFVIF